jgi:peptidyl-prolyl cis-trans isomerase SurA
MLSSDFTGGWRRGSRGWIKAIAWVWLVVVLVSTGGPARAEDTQRIAAVVNDDIISIFDVQARLSLVLVSSRFEDTPEVRKRLTPEVLRMLVDEKLEFQEAKSAKIQVPREEVTRAYKDIEHQSNLPEGALDKMLAQNNIPKSELETQLEAQILWNKVVRQKLSAKITAGDDEVAAMIERIEANKGKPELRVAEIFLPVENPAQEKEVQGLVEHLWEELKHGATFPALARGFSRSATAAQGGDMGWVSEGQLAPELVSRLSQMQPDQVSPPIRTQSGYQIVALVARRISPGLGDDDATVTLDQVLLPLASDAPPDQVKAEVEKAIGLTQSARSCADMETIAKTSNLSMSGRVGTVKIQSFPPEVRPLVESLKVNQPSRPVRNANGIVVLMVCERKENLDVENKRKRVKEMILRERYDIAARQYLRDLRRAAFLETRI